MTDDGPFTTGATRHGYEPTRLPAPPLTLPTLPDLDVCSAEELANFAYNCLANADDLALLAESDPHLRAILGQFGHLATLTDQQAEQLHNQASTIITLERQLAALHGQSLAYQGENEALRKAYAREVSAVQKEVAYSANLLAHNERLRREADASRRCVHGMITELSTALNELCGRDAMTELQAAFARACRSILGTTPEELSARLAPEPDPNAFDDSVPTLASGTDPVNKVVIDELELRL